jgi:hypothetical protein
MIVTLDIIKQEVGRMDDYHDEMIQRKLDESESIVIDYLKVDSDAYDNGSGINDFPRLIAAAVIAVARILYERPDDDPLSPAVTNILHRLRDPAMG